MQTFEITFSFPRSSVGTRELKDMDNLTLEEQYLLDSFEQGELISHFQTKKISPDERFPKNFTRY